MRPIPTREVDRIARLYPGLDRQEIVELLRLMDRLRRIRVVAGAGGEGSRLTP